jgi:hypothetical protein
MNKLALGTMLVGALAACGGGNDPQHDSGNGPNPACNPIAQTGCVTGERCTWIVDIDATESTDQVGHTGCAPGGELGDGQACTDATAADNAGADICVRGDLCVGGRCKPICDTQLLSGAGAGACKSDLSCVSYRAVFESGGNPIAGVCEPGCDPLTQQLKVGHDEACGSADATQPSDTCVPADDEFKAFACAPTLTLTATDRQPPEPSPDDTVFLNSCAPGYIAMYLEDLSGSMKVVCSGMCAPVAVDKDIAAMSGNARLNEGDARALGKLVADPRPVAGHSTCAAGIKGSDAVDGEDCRFLWLPLATRINNSRTPVNTPYNNTLGICFAFAHYTAIDTNDDGIADAAERSCAKLPRTAPPSNDPTAPFGTAADAGCYPLATTPVPPGTVANNPHRLVTYRLAHGVGRAVRHVFD